MDIIKETIGSKCIIRTTTYASTIDHFNMLFEIAKGDFPELNAESVSVIQYGGSYFKYTFGIEFRINDTQKIPSQYSHIDKAEVKL